MDERAYAETIAQRVTTNEGKQPCHVVPSYSYCRKEHIDENDEKRIHSDGSVRWRGFELRYTELGGDVPARDLVRKVSL